MSLSHEQIWNIDQTHSKRSTKNIIFSDKKSRYNAGCQVYVHVSECLANQNPKRHRLIDAIIVAVVHQPSKLTALLQYPQPAISEKCQIFFFFFAVSSTCKTCLDYKTDVYHSWKNITVTLPVSFLATTSSKKFVMNLNFEAHSSSNALVRRD